MCFSDEKPGGDAACDPGAATLKGEELVLEAARSAGVIVRSAAVEALSLRVGEEVRGWMSADELARHERYALERLRRRDLSTRGLARATLSELAGCAPHELVFEKGAHERPHLVSPALPGFDFNLAHSEERVVLAAAQGLRVGVDIEHGNRRVDHRNVAERFFSDYEQRALARLSDEAEEGQVSARRRRFLELWVLKEAWMKADGRGISAGLNQVIFDLDSHASPRLIALPDDAPERWEVALTELDDGHLLALAWRENSF
ncbi:4'-phosphopantetheinyl transferase family protein [Lujinxingia vulgaris]|nr:4'-phosphopantetheinyl transferase superfamily protein [Lujinxingia vulgaris]